MNIRLRLSGLSGQTARRALLRAAFRPMARMAARRQYGVIFLSVSRPRSDSVLHSFDCYL